MRITHKIKATPCLNGELAPSMSQTLLSNPDNQDHWSASIAACVTGSMNNARKYGVSFNDPGHFIVVTFAENT